MPEPLVLLADDFPDACDMYRAYLQFHGFRVITVGDGRAAVEAARTHLPDIILLDLRMPEMTGTEAMTVLRADPAFAGVPIVALTAHAITRAAQADVTAGFDAYLSKPITPDKLLQEITILLENRQASARGSKPSH